MTLKAPAAPGHNIRWFVYVGVPGTPGRERIRHQASMRGQWDYDVECSCGWQTKTGGAVRSHIEDRIYFHKLYASMGIEGTQ